MSERYSRLFSLGENLHTDGLPVVIAAGALLKDNTSGKVLAQIKFRNISDKTIKSVKVRINAIDTAGSALEGVDSFSYLDLSANNGETFGHKTPIVLPDAATRSFSVVILSVVSADGEVYSGNGEIATPAGESVKNIIQVMDNAILEAEHKAREERAAQDNYNKKVRKVMLGLSIIPLVLVFIAIILLSQNPMFSDGISEVLVSIWDFYGTAILVALLTPIACILASIFAHKNKKFLLIAGCISLLLLVVQIAGACIYVGAYTQNYGREMFFFAIGDIPRIVPGYFLFYDLRNVFRGKPMDATTWSQILFFLNNISAAIVMFFGAFKFKK